jgi:RNA polymerase sigma-70 factor (ECF subfamily)
MQRGELDFLSVYERYARDVHRFALYLSGDVALAQDITAETFARAWAVRERIRVGSIKGYLLMIARNLYRDARRKPVEARLSAAVDVSDLGSGPEASAQARHDLQVVLRALHQLPELDRAALLMAAVEGLPHHAIGIALGLSTAAVKVRVHRARVKLNAACGGGGSTI